MSVINQNIIGLSGHIDHGKTSIVKALTGKNTDSSKEEALRGMTINIGFAFLNDNITTQEFVVRVLKQIFNKTQEQADANTLTPSSPTNLIGSTSDQVTEAYNAKRKGTSNT